MKKFCFFATTLACLAFVISASQRADMGVRKVFESESSTVFGALCGGDSNTSLGDNCDRAANGAWSCGPDVNVQASGDCFLVNVTAQCGAGCTGSTSVYGPNCTGGGGGGEGG